MQMNTEKISFTLNKPKKDLDCFARNDELRQNVSLSRLAFFLSATKRHNS